MAMKYELSIEKAQRLLVNFAKGESVDNDLLDLAIARVEADVAQRESEKAKKRKGERIALKTAILRVLTASMGGEMTAQELVDSFTLDERDAIRTEVANTTLTVQLVSTACTALYNEGKIGKAVVNRGSRVTVYKLA